MIRSPVLPGKQLIDKTASKKSGRRKPSIDFRRDMEKREALCY